jgi:hypothetical protein
MARDAVPLSIPDLAAFARRLRAELAREPSEAGPPGHLCLLSQLARAAGFRNWQHLRASALPEPPAPPVDEERVARALRAFDAEGRMARWPNRTAVQGLCLWVLWARLPSRRDLSEAEVNAVLKEGSTFGDHVLLRRSLIDHGLATRTQDGGRYRRVERPPPPEARALIARVGRKERPLAGTGVRVAGQGQSVA